MNRQNYTDLNPRPLDLQDRIVMAGAVFVCVCWLAWIVEGLMR